MSGIEITLVKIEKLVVNNPKAMGIFAGLILVLVSIAIGSLGLGIIGLTVLFLFVLASLPRDVRRWLMRGLGQMGRDIWNS